MSWYPPDCKFNQIILETTQRLLQILIIQKNRTDLWFNVPRRRLSYIMMVTTSVTSSKYEKQVEIYRRLDRVCCSFCTFVVFLHVRFYFCTLYQDMSVKKKKKKACNENEHVQVACYVYTFIETLGVQVCIFLCLFKNLSNILHCDLFSYMYLHSSTDLFKWMKYHSSKNDSKKKGQS